jgi:hypothetical protein
MAEHQVLFCPFCRESFEGRGSCPDHELTLVSFDQLPPDESSPEPDDELDEARSRLPVDDRPLAALDPRHGRGLVALGALFDLLALCLRPLRLPGVDPPRTYQLAHAIPSLWTLLLVAFTVFFVLSRRRTPRALRSLRVLVPLLALVSPTTLVWAFVRLGGTNGHPLGGAVYAVAVSSLLLLVGGLRLGVHRSTPGAAHDRHP